MKQLSIVGRKRVITSEIVQKLREAFMMGFSDKEACIYSGICKSTLYNYQKEYPEFLDQKSRWKMYPVLLARKTIVDNIQKDVKTAQWYMERKMPQEFNPRHPLFGR